MSHRLIAALACSFGLHAASLVLLQADQALPPDRPPLLAKLVLPPRAPSELIAPVSPEPQKAPSLASAPVVAPSGRTLIAAAPAPDIVVPKPPVETKPVENRPVVPKAVVLPIAARGVIRYLLIRGTQGMIVGRTEHEWEFGNGNYRLKAMTETIGLAALIKSIRIEVESRGRLTPEGLQPQRYLTRRNGAETGETAEFDWTRREVTLSRSPGRHAVEEGAQDLLSFHYQLAYLPKLEEGTTLQVATDRRVEKYRFQIIGEETLETEAGVFRTLHLKTQPGTTTEIWLALDHGLLPVRIRHIDRKGDIYDQIAHEMGTPQEDKAPQRRQDVDNRPPPGFIP